MTAEVAIAIPVISPPAEASTTQQRVAKNAGIYLVAQLLSWVATFCYVSVVPRAFGQNMMGQLAFTGSASALVTTLFNMGIESYLITEIGREPQNTERLLRATFGLRVIIMVPCNILGWIVLFAIHASSLILYMSLFGTVSYFICVFTNPMRSVFAGWEQAKRVAILDVITVATPLFIIPFLGYGPAVIAYSVLVFTIISALLRIHWLRGQVWMRPSFDKPMMVSLMRGGLPFIVNDLLALFSTFVTLAILHGLVNDDAVGIYAQASKLLGTFMFVSAVVGAALLPAISRLATQDPARFQAAQTRVFGVLVIAGLPVMAGAIVLADPLCLLLYGTTRFVGMAPVLQCCAFSVIPLYIVSTMYQFLVAQRKNLQWTRYLIATYVIAALATLALVPLTQYYWRNGAIGAALALAFSETCGAIFAFYLLRTNPFAQGMGARIARAVVATLLMGGVMWVTRDLFVVIPAVLGTVVFVIAAWFLRALPAEEQALIVSVFLKKLGRFLPGRAKTQTL